MQLIKTYLKGLEKAYIDNDQKDEWADFIATVHGATAEDLEAIQKRYPEVPQSLLELLKTIDGTYWRSYGDKKVTFYLLGSDVFEYPYYLLSAKQIVESADTAIQYYDDYIDRVYDPEDVYMSDKIHNVSSEVKWLHFSDCMNNGGTSQLFIDFTPSEKGVKGQIVRFLHDPDEFEVIADSFDDYLQKCIDGDFAFVTPL